MQSTLHINDNNLLLQQGKSIERSQGYVWINRESLEFDQAAVKNCRLHPQQINSRYWQQCDQSSIPKNDAGMRHAGDLIWKHLLQYQQAGASELSLVVPSHYQSANLQLLLGIAKASNIKVTALVNKAVLATIAHIKEVGRYCHFDVQLHQTVVTWLEVKDTNLSVVDVEVIQDVGIQLIEEALLKSLQANFIQNDRFDPLHDAAYEQQLFDQLPQLISELISTSKATVSVHGKGHTHSVSYEVAELNAVLQPFFERLAVTKAQAKKAFIDFNAALGHSAPKQVSELGFEHLSSEALAPQTAFSYSGDGENLIYQTELPLQGAVASKPVNTAPATAKGSDGVLHLVFAGRAVAIEHAQIELAAGQLDLSYAKAGNAALLLKSGQLFVLGDENRKQLRANDRLGSTLVDGVLSVVQVIAS